MADLVDSDSESGDESTLNGSTLGNDTVSTFGDRDDGTVSTVGTVDGTVDASVASGVEEEEDNPDRGGNSYRPGDPKAPKKSKEWCGTGFQGETGIHPFARRDEFIAFYEKGKPKVVTLSAGMEFTKTGRPHYQIFIEFASTKSKAELIKWFPWCDWDPRLKNSTNWCAYKYTLKGAGEWKKAKPSDNYGSYDERYKDVPGYHPDTFLLSLGVVPEERVFGNKGKRSGNQGDRNDVYPTQLELLKGRSLRELTLDPAHCRSIAKYASHFMRFVIENTPPYRHHAVRGIMLVGDFGVGKSRIVQDIFDPENQGLIFFKRNHDKLFDGYIQHPYICQDELPLDSKFDLNLLKHVADSGPVNGRILYGNTPLSHRCYILTSNHTFEELVEERYKNSAANIKRQLIGALNRRFHIFRYTEFSRVTVNTELVKLKAYHDKSPEEQAVEMERQTDRHLRKIQLTETIRQRGCPPRDLVDVLKLYNAIESETDAVKKRHFEAQLARKTSTWIGRPVEPIVLPELPKCLEADPNPPLVAEVAKKKGVKFLTLDIIDEVHNLERQRELEARAVTPSVRTNSTTPSTENTDEDRSVDTSDKVVNLLEDDLSIDMTGLLGRAHDEESVEALKSGDILEDDASAVEVVARLEQATLDTPPIANLTYQSYEVAAAATTTVNWMYPSGDQYMYDSDGVYNPRAGDWRRKKRLREEQEKENEDPESIRARRRKTIGDRPPRNGPVDAEIPQPLSKAQRISYANAYVDGFNPPGTTD